jgi:formylglycine-generating enzyme required for sulfatase activity
LAAQETSVKQVFISHATEADGEFAGRLAGDLRRLGIAVWIAPDSIQPGEAWVDAIERGLGESSHLVVVLTPAALESEWVEMETDTAIALERNGRIKVIPLDVKACQAPLLLSNYQMVGFRGGYDGGLSQLVRVLGVSVPSAEPAPAPPQAPERAPAPEVVSPPVVERRQPFEPELIHIPAGEFLMGSDPSQDEDARDSEQPQHSLHLPGYTIAKTPVTNAQYLAFVQATNQKPPEHWNRGKPPGDKADHPVVYVSWQEAVAYCEWLAETTGRAYRLPGEAEWEKAARGTDGRIWPWGNEWDPKRPNSEEGGRRDTTPVGQYSPRGDSPYGCVDMAGNVQEWTLSLWGGGWEEPEFRYPYDPEDGRQNLGAGNEVRRVMRGGAFDLSQGNVRCADRNRHYPVYRLINLGFRVCVAAR